MSLRSTPTSETDGKDLAHPQSARRLELARHVKTVSVQSFLSAAANRMVFVQAWSDGAL